MLEVGCACFLYVVLFHFANNRGVAPIWLNSSLTQSALLTVVSSQLGALVLSFY